MKKLNWRNAKREKPSGSMRVVILCSDGIPYDVNYSARYGAYNCRDESTPEHAQEVKKLFADVVAFVPWDEWLEYADAIFERSEEDV